MDFIKKLMYLKLLVLFKKKEDVISLDSFDSLSNKDDSENLST